MSKEYATLLAQVVPVLALALGLEIRATVSRAKQRADGDEPTQPFRSGALLGCLGVILAFLAGVEIRALYVVAGPGFWSNLVVPSATAVVFLAVWSRRCLGGRAHGWPAHAAEAERPRSRPT